MRTETTIPSAFDTAPIETMPQEHDTKDALHDVEWVPLYDVGRVVNHLQAHGMTYAEMSRQTGVASYLLRKAKLAYSKNDRTTVTAKSRVEGLKRASTTRRRPTDATMVSHAMRRQAQTELEDLIERGLTISHIASMTGLNDKTIATAGQHDMTWATYQRIMLALPDLKGNLQDGFGTSKAAHRRARSKLVETQRAKRQSHIKAVMAYLKEHPDAQMTDVSRDLGIKMRSLGCLRRREPKLAKTLPSRLETARRRDAVLSAMLDENPDLRCIEVQERFDISKATAHSMLVRVKARRETRPEEQGHGKQTTS